MRPRVLVAAAATLLTGSLAVPGSQALAQDVEALGARFGVTPPPGYYEEMARNPLAFQFQQAWIQKVQQINARRAVLLQSADIDGLNAAFPGGFPSRAAASASAAAVTGTVKVPVLLGGFSNITASPFDSSMYQAKLFDTTPPRPYSVTTYYTEVSRGLLTVTGDVFGWFAGDSADTYYEGSSNCLNTGTSKCGELLTELFIHYDSIVDFGDYDNDGPDGMPNSGDDDGIVDFVAIVHPEIGGECGGSNIWSHRFVYRAWPASGGTPYTTTDARTGGGSIMIDDYIIQGGVGGPTICGAPASIMPIGVITHETGHAFNVPDLYDTSVGSFGVGHWELMATGGLDNEAPSHMSAWSLQFLGWAAVDTIQPGFGGFRSFDVTPVARNDTVWALCTAAIPANCFSEQHFMLENRQLIGSDSTSLPGTGLLIWHVDPSIIGSCTPPQSGGCAINRVNNEPDPGYDLEEADGLRQQNSYVNRGDAGDPFPGTSSNTTFGTLTNPPSVFNDSTPTNILVDSIALNPDSSVHVAVSYSTIIATVQSNVAGTNVIIDSNTSTSPTNDAWQIGSVHTIEVDSIQPSPTLPGTRHVWQTWSDGGLRSHSVTAGSNDTTLQATLNVEHLVTATTSGTGTGTISSTTPLDGMGQAWLVLNDADTLAASADPGSQFLGWEGDTTTANDTLILIFDQPWTVQAIMALPVMITETSPLVSGLMGAAYLDTLLASGGTGSYVWSTISGALPAGTTLDTTGVLSGTPEEKGTFNFTVVANSGGLADTMALAWTINEPSVTIDAVVTDLLTSQSTLSSEERNFMDLQGNKNGRYDVGDLRAWLIATGNLTPAIAEAIAEAGDDEDGTAKKDGDNDGKGGGR